MEDVFVFFSGFIVLLGFLGLVLYVLSALGLSRMANKLGIENSWMAWLPVVNIYLTGKIAGDEVEVFGKEITNLSVVLAVASVVIGAISAIPVIGQLALIVYCIVYYSALHKVFKIFNEDSAKTLTILSIVFAILFPVFIFATSGKEPNMSIFSGGDGDDIEF